MGSVLRCEVTSLHSTPRHGGNVAGQPLTWAHVQTVLQMALKAACGRDSARITAKPVHTHRLWMY